MTLDTYLAQPNAKSLTALALEVGISKGRLSQLRHKTDWPPELALKVEQATGGVINASWLSHTVATARAA
jgi:DNA-binding transcriptional regulator YdaS (Cro superfamily)